MTCVTTPACDTSHVEPDRRSTRTRTRIAHATITYAQNTEAVNDVRGKGNFKPRLTGAAEPRRDVRRGQRRSARQRLRSRVLAVTSEGLRPEPLTSHA